MSTTATTPQHHIPSRVRFPVRPSVASPIPSVEPQPTSSQVTSVEPSSFSVETSVQQSETEQVTGNFVRGKSVNDLYTFSRLQNAIHSRNGGREELAVVGM